jgi:hypothetical protein
LVIHPHDRKDNPKMTISHAAGILGELRSRFAAADHAATMTTGLRATADNRPTEPGSAPRSLHDACEAARLVACGYCWTDRGQSCRFTGTRARPVDGWHLQRLARARRKGLLSEADMSAVIEAAGVVLAPGTMIWADSLGGAS